MCIILVRQCSCMSRYYWGTQSPEALVGCWSSGSFRSEPIDWRLESVPAGELSCWVLFRIIVEVLHNDVFCYSCIAAVCWEPRTVVVNQILRTAVQPDSSSEMILKFERNRVKASTEINERSNVWTTYRTPGNRFFVSFGFFRMYDIRIRVVRVNIDINSVSLLSYHIYDTSYIVRSVWKVPYMGTDVPFIRVGTGPLYHIVSYSYRIR